MAESIGIDSARLVLAHALLLILGKASHKVFEVVDSVDCLESSSVYRKCASPRGVPDAIAPRDSINLLKNAVYARAAEAMGLCPHCR